MSTGGDSTDIVLAFAGSELADAQAKLADLAVQGVEHDERLSRIGERLGELQKAFGDPTVGIDDRSHHLGAATTSRKLLPADTDGPEWAELVDRARRHFEERGVDPDNVDLAALLDPEEMRDAGFVSDRRGEFTCRLDLIDVMIATTAGLAAAVVDLSVVKIPRPMRFHGQPQQGSPLTKWLRSQARKSDNFLARRARVPYDSMMTDDPLAHLGPRTHRIDTFGHDPFVGFIVGVRDILHGTSTGVDRSGRMFHVPIGPPQSSLVEAVGLQFAHLLSDVLTRAGLPLPGWTLLRLINAGDIDGQTVGQLARQMYLRGFDTWHGMTMATSVATAELTLRFGWGLRAIADDDWRQKVELERRITNASHVSHHPRFLTMSLVAHAIAAAANAGKIAMTGGNPLAMNAVEWYRFARVVAKWWGSHTRRPTDVLAIRSDVNLEALLSGWPT